MGLRLHCDADDAEIERGERYLEIRLINRDNMPIVAKTYCVEHASVQGRVIVPRFFDGVWTAIDAKWREG